MSVAAFPRECLASAEEVFSPDVQIELRREGVPVEGAGCDQEMRLWVQAMRRFRDACAAPDTGSALAEPAWDMLLVAFLARWDRHPLTVCKLSSASHVPTATGLRHITRLVTLGYIQIEASRHDRRVRLVRLTQAGEARVKEVFRQSTRAFRAVLRAEAA